MEYKLLTTLLILSIGVLGIMASVSAKVVWRVAPNDFVWTEDNTNIVDLSHYVTSDKGSVTFTVGGNLQHIHATLLGSILTLVPDTNWDGKETLVLTATDSDNIAASTSVDLIVNPVAPVPTMGFTFGSVKVNDVSLSTTNPNVISFERGSTLDVNVEFSTNSPSGNNDVRVKSWIGGYEFGDLSDQTDIFDMVHGVRYVKTLHLQIPNDINVGSDTQSSEFTLHVEAFDKENAQSDQEFILKIDKIRHKLDILDVIFYPGNTVEPGRALRSVVRVENFGQKDEDNILVRVSIPDLGVSTRTYIDQLVSTDNNNNDNTDQLSSASSRDLVLYIPQDAKPGQYDVETDVEYSSGHETVSKKSTILVQGPEVPTTVPTTGNTGGTTTTTAPNALISIDTTTQEIGQGSEAAYKLMVANLGSQRALYTVTVEGESAWATSKVSPSFISVDANQAGESLVYIKPLDNAPLGSQSFKVDVLANGNLVKQFDLRANVVAKATEISNLGILRNGLEISFVVLIAVLIILGLIIAFRRVGGVESRREEPSESVGEGQTYY